ncbi:MAG: serine/threonine-protein kinase, partial [Gemmatimonadota bacterium]|nr:serine/threonine-protein kinase [Gemmatimonadota bacterium]
MNAPPSPPAPPPSGNPANRRHPETIGPYRIIGTLGEGGMGTVYEAEQDQPHRVVALKIIRHDFVSPELIRRFSLESEVLGRLQHPGIAQIYQAGTFEDSHGSRPFFAMELVKGQPLTEYLRSQTLDMRQRLELFARICDAVHYAHQQGVIHRDLKPANIMVDAAGQPKILDFGVARLTDADVQATRQTSVGEVIGTLQYMSPEQVNADPTDIDTRSDVYSLGVILYEVLSGRLPYDLARKLIYEAARIILIDDPARLSSIDRNFKGDVEIIVAKALEKEKRRRYGSAEELASDVRRFLNDEPIVARPATAMYQIRKFAKRHRALVGGIALAALALVAGTAVSLWQAVRATAAERVAETRRGEAVAAGALAERRREQADSALRVADSARADALREQAAAKTSAQRATGEAAKASAVNDFLQNMLASSDPANARGKELSVREVLDQAALTVHSGNLKRPPEVTAGVETAIGRTYFGLGLYDKARPHLDSAYAIRRRVLGPSGGGVGESAFDLG